MYRFVRLRDYVDGVTTQEGPDIDAVGAIGSYVADADGDGTLDDRDPDFSAAGTNAPQQPTSTPVTTRASAPACVADRSDEGGLLCSVGLPGAVRHAGPLSFTSLIALLCGTALLLRRRNGCKLRRSLNAVRPRQ